MVSSVTMVLVGVIGVTGGVLVMSLVSLVLVLVLVVVVIVIVAVAVVLLLLLVWVSSVLVVEMAVAAVLTLFLYFTSSIFSDIPPGKTFLMSVIVFPYLQSPFSM